MAIIHKAQHYGPTAILIGHYLDPDTGKTLCGRNIKQPDGRLKPLWTERYKNQGLDEWYTTAERKARAAVTKAKGEA